MTITAVIITQNEERNIGRCLQSLQGVADEIVVVDSGSADATESLCRSAGAHFEHHNWEGFAGQKNYANTLASCEWILSIDADEALSDKLRESIKQLKSADENNHKGNVVYSINRITNYCGHWVRHCGWYPDWCCRLWKKDMARWVGAVHEVLEFHDEVNHLRLDGNLEHYSYYTVSEHLTRISRYASLGAAQYYEKGKRCGVASIVLRPLWNFLRNYLLKGGILDGWAGFTICCISAMYTMVKYAELYRLCNPAENQTQHSGQ